MNLIFSYVHPSQPSITIGPFGMIWLNSEGMRSEREGDLRAPYLNHQWKVDGQEYFRLDCTANVDIRFERGTQRSSNYGPYMRFSAVNGLAYADDKVIASMDYKSHEWLFYDSGYHWPTMIVTSRNR